MDKEDGKKSVKIDLIPANNWDGWLVVAERKPREEFFEKETGSDLEAF